MNGDYVVQVQKWKQGCSVVLWKPLREFLEDLDRNIPAIKHWFLPEAEAIQKAKALAEELGAEYLFTD